MFTVLRFLWMFINYRKWNILILILFLICVTISMPFCFITILILLPIYLFKLFYYGQTTEDKWSHGVDEKYLIWNIVRNVFWDEPRFFIYSLIHENNLIKLKYEKHVITLITYIISVIWLNIKWLIIYPCWYIFSSTLRFSDLIWGWQSQDMKLTIRKIINVYCFGTFSANFYNSCIEEYIETHI